MNNGNFLKEIINYLESNYLIFLVAYILVVIVQLIVLYKKSSGMRIILFSVHKIIAFVAIGYLLLYCRNILGFYLYVIGVVTLAFSCSTIKKEFHISFLDYGKPISETRYKSYDEYYKTRTLPSQIRSYYDNYYNGD